MSDSPYTGAATPLQSSDIDRVAAQLGVDDAVIRAVMTVEAGGTGYLPDGRPKILFEAAYFHRLTGGRYDESHPDISSPTWNASLYRGGAAEYDRLAEAAALDATAALKSASWGMFQIMGANYGSCGYASVQDFVAAMEQSAGAQLTAFADFVTHAGLIPAMRSHDWAAFAAKYNGPGYKQNRYDTSLANAYARAKGSAETDAVLRLGEVGPSVAWLQQQLQKAGVTVDVDSNFGAVTEMALRTFQVAHGLTPDGIAGPATLAALGAVV